MLKLHSWLLTATPYRNTLRQLYVSEFLLARAYNPRADPSIVFTKGENLMLKRLLILVVMIGLLFVVSNPRPARAEAFCSCSMACFGGQPGCNSICYGGTEAEREAGWQLCCQEAKANTPIQCNAN
jgi:hypothetical protein